MYPNKIYEGDSNTLLKEMPDEFADVVYMDPPFFTQKKHSLVGKKAEKVYEFNDTWSSKESYSSFMRGILLQCQRILKNTGSIFLHCDRAASHLLRETLDAVFGAHNFQSEIIWYYKRWSNSKKGLLNAHQTIFFYSKSKHFKFNKIYTDYSPSTNVDQILQARERGENGKAVYKRDKDGRIVLGKGKKGVPLSDVWEIPYLNPKAKERVGYPTQKPVVLLRRILEISTAPSDMVLDPFAGSGTSCVAAKSMGRNFIGMDISKDAVALAERRLEEMVITESHLLNNGIERYKTKSELELALLKSLGAIPVQRNSGIDGFLKEHYEGSPVPVRIQKPHESLSEAKDKMARSCSKKNYALKILVQTQRDNSEDRLFQLENNIKVIKSPQLLATELRREHSPFR